MTATTPAVEHRLRRRLLVGATAALLGLGVVLQVWGPLLSPGWGAPGAPALWAIGFTTMGAAIARQRSGNPVGWRLLVAGLFAAVLYVTTEVMSEAGRLPATWTDLAAITSSWSWTLAVAPLATAVLRFPDGGAPSPRWRFVEPALWSVVAVFSLATIFGPPESGMPALGITNPLEITTAASVLRPLSVDGGLVYLPLQLLLAACIASVFVRYRRASGIQRQQLKLLGLAGALTGITVFLVEAVVSRWVVTEAGFVNPTWITSLIVLLLPIAMGAAILRYRLYDVDRLVSRTVTYVVVTAVLLAAYVGLVVVFQAALRPLTPESDLAVAASTLAVAALFGPVRQRVQHFVDRRFNRARYDAAKAVEMFGQRLRDEVDLDQVASELQRAAARTVEPTSVAVWLRGDVVSEPTS